MTSMLLGAINLPVSAKTDGAPAQVSSSMPGSPTDETKVPHYYGPYSNYANSPYTLANAIVTITGDGTGATANATVGLNGAVTGFAITNPGAGYTAATVEITGSGTGATATATVNLSGSVTKINVDVSGAGYKAPVVTITGGGVAVVNATAMATVGSIRLWLIH